MDTSTYPVTRTEAEWRKRLTPEQFADPKLRDR